VNGAVILYADQETESIRETLDETNRRRELQQRYNALHGITPTTIQKRITSIRDSIWEQDYVTVPTHDEREDEIPEHELPALLDGLRREMREAAKALDFERAAALRDRIAALESERLRLG
jgi:excinuclease ABC subunit B